MAASHHILDILTEVHLRVTNKLGKAGSATPDEVRLLHLLVTGTKNTSCQCNQGSQLFELNPVRIFSLRKDKRTDFIFSLTHLDFCLVARILKVITHLSR